MLLQFTVENVLSFRDETVLSLLAAPGVEHAPGQVIEVPGLPRPVLRVAAIYGANASGKSNLVKAMEMARDLIQTGTRPGTPIKVVPFKLDPDARERPCRFEFEFWLDGRRWSYGFACTPARIEAEWLYLDVEDGEREVFKRSVAEDGQSVIEIGDALKLEEERRRFWEFVAEGTRPNQLFLAETTERNVGELGLISDFFFRGLIYLAAGQALPKVARYLSEHPSLLLFASQLVRDAGTGVEEVQLIADPSGDELEQQATGILAAPSTLGQVAAMHMPPLQEKRLRIRFLHSAGNRSEKTVLDAEEESDGTRRLVELSPFLFLLENADGALLIDELDRSLHTLLSRNLLGRFLAAEPSSSGQLIFTTHDTNLLDLVLLPQDSIWFVEKDLAGGSTLYSLAEFKAEQLEQLGNDLESGYLRGRFGAIPFLSDPRRLGWIKKDTP